jgi:hypothetical protein
MFSQNDGDVRVKRRAVGEQFVKNLYCHYKYIEHETMGMNIYFQ